MKWFRSVGETTTAADEEHAAGQWPAERVLPVYMRPRHATGSMASSVTILSSVMNNALHPATVGDGPWSRSKTMKQRSLGPETKFWDDESCEISREPQCQPTRMRLMAV